MTEFQFNDYVIQIPDKIKFSHVRDMESKGVNLFNLHGAMTILHGALMWQTGLTADETDDEIERYLQKYPLIDLVSGVVVPFSTGLTGAGFLATAAAETQETPEENPELEPKQSQKS